MGTADGPPHCPSCGAVSDDRFCGRCGARQEPPRAANDADTRRVDDDGLPTADLHIGPIDDVAARIERDGPLLVPDASGRLAVVAWDPSYESESGSALERYGSEGEDHPVLDERTAVMVLSLRSTHHGCLVPFCESSQWFEDPCHGSRWNRCVDA